MIWLRRGGAAVLGIPLTALLLAALVLLRLNSTFLSPDFYADQLRQADIYRFAIDDVVPAAIDELRDRDPAEAGVDLRENPIAASGLETARIGAAVRRALPPEELEALADPAVRATVAYVTGEQTAFTVDPPLGPVLRDIVHELLALLREAGGYERLLERELEPRIREAAGGALASDAAAPGWMQRLFGSDEGAGGRLSRVVLSVVTPEWFGDQVEQIAEALTAYLVGDTDGFTIHVRLGDEQADTAIAELRSVLRETDSADLVYTEILDPRVDEEVEETVELPYGVTVGREEVKAVLREAAPGPWVQQQADAVAGDVSSYVAGRSDGFSTEIALAARKQEAAQLLTTLAVARVAAAIGGLEACAGEAGQRAAAAAASDTLPECLPAGVTAGELLAAASGAIAAAIPPLVLDPVPDTVAYTHEDLRSDLLEDGGPGALDALDDTRELFAEGWRYSEADLRADLADDPEALRTLDRLRTFLANGYVHTPDDPAAAPLAETIEQAREVVSPGRDGSLVPWLMIALLLVAIGALGGRSWPGRVGWAAASLLAASGVVLVLSWPLYETASGLLFEEARDQIAAESAGDFPATVQLIAGKLVDTAEGALDEFAGGIRNYSLVIAAVALVALLGALYGKRKAAATGSPEPPR